MWLKTISVRKLILVGVAAVALLAFGSAIAQGGASKAPRTTLSKMVISMNRDPQILGVSARVEWKNNLLGDLPINNPLLAGGSGRMWADGNSNLRAELQGESGDSQLLVKGNQIQIWDAQGNTLYSWNMKAPRTRKAARNSKDKDWLSKLGQYWNISQPQSTIQADRSAYRIRLTPKQPMGLLGGMDLVVDAQYKLPLSFLLYAKDVVDPVVSLQATQADFSAVDGSVFNWQAPADAKKINFNSVPGKQSRSSNKINAKLAAPVLPGTLVGLAGTQTVKQKGMVVTTYGEGLNGLIVVQSPSSKTDSMIAQLPKVQVGGQSLPALQTPLGGMIQASKDGISTTVIGSQTQARLIQAMQELL